MSLLQKRIQCLVDNGWWYTRHKALNKLFGCLDPAQDPRWPPKWELFLIRHPEKRIAAPLTSANTVSVNPGCLSLPNAVSTNPGYISHNYEDIGKVIWEEQQNELSYQDQLQEISKFSKKPLISVIMPLYNAPVRWLELAIESIQNQSYTNWELCMADDGSKDLRCVKFAAKMAKEDSRIKFHRCEKNGGISAASNVALEMASGEYIALIDQDDAIPGDAFFWFIKEINLHPDADFLYSDECKTDASEQIHPSCYYFKPDWSQFLLLNHMYTGHLTMYRTKLVREVGGFRSQFDFSQDYDLALRMGDATKNIYHIERLLYYWRIIPTSAASGGKSFSRTTNIASTHDWCKRHGIEATHDSVDSPSNFGQVKHTNNPLVSIIIPTDSLEMLSQCIDGINGPKTSYHNVEIIPVTNSHVAEKITKDYPYADNLRILRYDEPFNFSRKCNEGAKIAEGEYLVFYNDDVLPSSPDWIERLLDVFSYPDVGGVSPALLHEDGRIQYAGMITGTPGLVGTSFDGHPFSQNVPMVFTQYLVRDVSVLSGACMMMRKDEFRQLGGFDEINTPNGHSDVDISFRLMEAGKKCVYTPFSIMTHIGNHSWAEKKRKDKSDIFCLKRWGKYIANDRFFTRSMRRSYYWDFTDEYQIYYPKNYQWDFNHTGRDILYVTHELSRTGAPLVLISAVKASVANGDFAVVVSPEDGKLKEEFLNAGAIVIVDAMARNSNWLFQRFACNFDAVVCNTLAAYWAIDALNGRNVAVIWWIHESELAFHNFKENIPKKIEKNISVYAVSDYVERLLKDRGIPSNGKLVFGLDDYTADQNMPERETIRFIVSGSLEKRKGQDIAIQAFMSIPETIRKKSELLFVGQVIDKDIENLITRTAEQEKNIKLLQPVNHEEMMKLFADSNVVLVPSREEPMPTTAVEAFILGKVCIVSDHCGIASFISDGKNGFVFENENSEQLAEKMLYLLREPELAHKIGTEGRKIFETNFTRNDFNKNYMGVLEKALKECRENRDS